MVKIFISMPMNGKTDEEIRRQFQESGWYISQFMSGEIEDDFEIIDTNIPNAPETNSVTETRLWYLGRSIQLLGTADVVIFWPDWYDHSGCKVEHMAAKEYGIKTLYFPTSFLD